MININLIGRLGADAEVKQSSKGTDYVSFRIATDDYVDGKKETAWFNAFSTTPQSLRVAKFLTKGTMIHLHGTETVRLYTNKAGEKVIARDILVTSLDFVNSGKPKDEETKNTETSSTEATTTTEQPQIQITSAQSSAQTVASAPATSNSVSSYPSQDLEDLPF